MGAIFGIVGQGSLAEVQAMGRRLGHRGAFQAIWSPAPEVYFGQLGREPFTVDSAHPVAGDCQLDGGSGLTGDLEVLFQRLGVEGFGELRGSFALAVYDRDRRTLTLAVDQVGFKQLFYVVLPGRFAFASEYKALLALADLPIEPDRTAIQHYLATKQPLQGRSFVAGIRSLLGGQALQYREARCSLTTYWQAQAREVERTHTEHARVVRDGFLDAVHRQIEPYREIGITLSGGLDAAAVLAAVRRVAPDLRVHSFTIGTSENDSEIVGAREVADLFGTEHHEYILDVDEIPRELPRLVWLCEDCGAREEALLQLRVVREAAAHAPAVIGGHGADALFAGMPRHRLVGLAGALPWLETPLREVFCLTQAGEQPVSLAGRLGKRLLYPNGFPEVPTVPGAQPLTRVSWTPRVNEYIRVGIQRMNDFNYLEPVHEVSQTAFHSPFLDPDFIATSLTVPGSLKAGLRRPKWILRQAVAELLPRSIIQRPKTLQRLNLGQRLSAVLQDTADRWLAASALDSYGLLQKEYVETLRVNSSRAGLHREHLNRLWTVLSLESWARQFLAQRGVPSGLTAEDHGD